jgi:hypothetical protein
MRVNVYAEEITDKVELIHKTVEGHDFTAVRFYLELPVTVGGAQYQGPFIHRPGDDDSAAVTFWGKVSAYHQFKKAIKLIEEHFESIGQSWRLKEDSK